MLKRIAARIDRTLDLLERGVAALEKIAAQPPQPITVHQTTPLPSTPLPPNPIPTRGPGLPGIQPWPPYDPWKPTFPGWGPNGPEIWAGVTNDLKGDHTQLKSTPHATKVEPAAETAAPDTLRKLIQGYYGSEL
jgi:hypothetical protein